MNTSQNFPLYLSKGETFNKQALFMNVVETGQPLTNISFEINEHCPLLAEHFPGFPVVPASLIIGLTASLLEKSASYLNLTNIRFNQPLVPGKEYRCEFKQKNNEQVMFIITDQHNVVYTKGIYHQQITPIIIQEIGESHAA